MSECEEKICYLARQATEVLLHIFAYVDAKTLVKARRVCVRWRCIIDSLHNNSSLWREYCKRDYPQVYQSAYERRSPIGRSWYSLYKSLSLWPKLASARERCDEFSPASEVAEEILDFKIVDNDLIAVHKKGSIDYYDIETFERARKNSIFGNYLQFNENSWVIIILNFELYFYILLKNCETDENLACFENVKTYLLKDKMVYFVNFYDEIYCVNTDNKNLSEQLIKQSAESIMCLGYSTHLHVLTFQRRVYSVIGNDYVYVCGLEYVSNIMHHLKQYNFLESLHWRVYFQWIYVLNHSIPDGPLRDIVVVRTYGDMVFVGSNWGVLRIYCSPYCNGELNLHNSVPIKQYNFMERKDCPVLSNLCPIIQIDIIETEDGHIVLVGMPKKVAIIEYLHIYKRTASVALLPYKEVERVKILKIND